MNRAIQTGASIIVIGIVTMLFDRYNNFGLNLTLAGMLVTGLGMIWSK